MNERPVQRDTQVKRQLAIDCGQNGFRYISYCHYASSIDLKREINVPQACFLILFYFYFVPWQVVRVDLEKEVDLRRVVVLLLTDTSPKLTEEKKTSGKSVGFFFFHSKLEANFFLHLSRTGGCLSISGKPVEWHWWRWKGIIATSDWKRSLKTLKRGFKGPGVSRHILVLPKGLLPFRHALILGSSSEH